MNQKIKIAIKFGDNDFGNTFRGVLSMLFDASKWKELPEDKDKLCWIINQLAPIAYITHQNSWEYNGLEKAVPLETEKNEEFIHIQEYLKLRLRDLLMSLDESFDNHVLIVQKDSEGNGYSPLAGVDVSPLVYKADTTYSGEVYKNDDEENAKKDLPSCVVLYPTN